jgi:hypothetical protein
VGLYGVIFQHDPHALALSHFLVEDEVTHLEKKVLFETSQDQSREQSPPSRLAQKPRHRRACKSLGCGG